MHAAAFAALGLPHRYLAFHVPATGLAAALRGAAALGFGGLNLTIPHKQSALALCDVLAPAARRIGAVNTICFHEGQLVGHNTDGRGFAAAARTLGVETAQRALILGGGGGALAVVDALSQGLLSPTGEALWVSRDPAGLVARGGADPRVRATGYDQLPRPGTVDLLVNCTSVGLASGPREFPTPLGRLLALLAPGARVIDIVYPRAPGGLLDRAEARGAVVQDGLEMLLWQGVLAEELWLGQELGVAAVAAMRAALGG